MKANRLGRACILTPSQITLLFNEGFINLRDRALFGICLYAAARIDEACTLLRDDVIGVKGVKNMLVIRNYNTKGKQQTREIQVHPQLKEYIEEYHRTNKWHSHPHLFPGRHGRNHICKVSADAILRKVCQKLELKEISSHSFRCTTLAYMSDNDSI